MQTTYINKLQREIDCGQNDCPRCSGSSTPKEETEVVLIEVGDRVRCLYGNSGNKFNTHIWDTFPVVTAILPNKSAPDQFAVIHPLTGNSHIAYVNDFEVYSKKESTPPYKTERTINEDLAFVTDHPVDPITPQEAVNKIGKKEKKGEAEEEFYCKEQSNVGYTCDEQCKACSKHNQLVPGEVHPVIERIVRGWNTGYLDMRQAWTIEQVLQNKELLSLSQQPPQGTKMNTTDSEGVAFSQANANQFYKKDEAKKGKQIDYHEIISKHNPDGRNAGIPGWVLNAFIDYSQQLQPLPVSTEVTEDVIDEIIKYMLQDNALREYGSWNDGYNYAIRVLKVHFQEAVRNIKLSTPVLTDKNIADEAAEIYPYPTGCSEEAFQSIKSTIDKDRSIHIRARKMGIDNTKAGEIAEKAWDAANLFHLPKSDKNVDPHANFKAKQDFLSQFK